MPIILYVIIALGLFFIACIAFPFDNKKGSDYKTANEEAFDYCSDKFKENLNKAYGGILTHDGKWLGLSKDSIMFYEGKRQAFFEAENYFFEKIK